MTTYHSDSTNEDAPMRRGTSYLKDAHINAISLVDRGANNKRFFLFKRADHFIDEFGNLTFTDSVEETDLDDEAVDKILPIVKGTDVDADGNWTTVYCVVAVPGEVDQQKDIWLDDEIKKSAHDFLKQGPLINYMHADLNKVGELVESAIALTNIEINGEQIPKGSWYIAVEPHEEVRKQINSGQITGVSVQGTSRREPVDKAAAPVAVVAAPPAPPAPTPGEQAKQQRTIPIGSEGPGIQKLQHVLGIPETGTFDEATQAAFVEFLKTNGANPTPTLAALQDVLGRVKAVEDHVNATAGEPANVPATKAVTTVSKDSGYQSDTVGTNMSFAANGMRYDVTGPMNGAATTVNSVSQAATNAQAPSKASDLVQMVQGDNCDPEDLKVALYLSAMRGNHLLMDHLSSVYGINSPADIFTSNLTLDQLQMLVGMYILGVFPGGQPDSEPQLVDGDGNGMSTQLNKGWLPAGTSQGDLDDGDFAWLSDAYKAGKASKSEGRKLPYKIHGKVNEAGWRAAWAAVNGSHGGTDFGGGPDMAAVKAKLLADKPKDIQISKAGVTDQNGDSVDCGDTVMMDPDDLGEGGRPEDWSDSDAIDDGSMQSAYVVAVTSPYLAVLTNDSKGVPTHKVVHSKKVKKFKAPQKVKKAVGADFAEGDIVTWNNGNNAGLVVSVSGDSVVVSTQTKANKNLTNTTMKASDLTKYIAKTTKTAVKKAVGGSYDGHAPSANGKIRFIVRAFGTWAGGLERICVARIVTEHPEVVAGRDPNALCAWLKDQWLGNTHWRQGRQGVAKAVDDYLTNELLEELNEAELDVLFETISQDIGIDSAEVLEKMSTDDYNEYLDGLFPEDASDENEVTEEEKTLVQKFLGIFKSSKSQDDKAAEARTLFISDVEDTDTEKEQLVNEALIKFETELTVAVELGSESVTATLDDFDTWVKDVFDSEREETVTKNTDTTSAVDVVSGNSNNGDNMENVEKGLGLDAEQLDRIQHTRDFLDSLLGSATTAAESTEADEVVEVAKEAAEEVVTEEAPAEVADATDTTLNDVISFVNRLADHVEGLSKQAEENASLSEKLDTISELVKSVDVSDRLEALQTEIDSLKLAVAPVSDEVAEVSKRLDQIGNTAGTRTSAPAHEQEVVNKSVTAMPWVGRFH